ncbi:hypothetical protein [Yoonia sp. SS1-5]|uniref:Uncharacterized protein n=1 Tax=Yoonia rhodophyticola TaxID=3137370 RepID=A0AAN0MAR9_9RHOB
MFKHLAAAIAAASLAFSSPAQAAGLDRDDVGKLIIGLAAIAALNAAIEGNNDRSRPQAAPVHDQPHHRQWGDQNRGNRWSELNRQTNRRVLPASCLRRIETRFGTQRMFGQRCLERNYRHAASLPDRCAVRVYSNEGPRRGYDPLCLREQGYVSDRRH